MMGEEYGYALVFTLFIILFTGIAATVIIPAVQIQLNLTANMVDSRKALYAAEAGIVYSKYLLERGERDFPLAEEIYLSSNLLFTIYIEEEPDCYHLQIDGIFKDNSISFCEIWQK